VALDDHAHVVDDQALVEWVLVVVQVLAVA